MRFEVSQRLIGKTIAFNDNALCYRYHFWLESRHCKMAQVSRNLLSSALVGAVRAALTAETEDVFVVFVFSSMVLRV